MLESSPQDVTESLEERMQRRRARRWKRRARIVGPFLGVLLLVGMLALSVDIIEYQPQTPRDRLSDRPLPDSVLEKQSNRGIPVSASVSTASVVPAQPMANGGGGSGFDVTLMPAEAGTDLQPRREFSPPMPPYATWNQR